MSHNSGRDSCSTDAQCTLHKMCINNRCVRGTGTGIRCSKDDSCPQMAACKFHECACHSSRQCPWSEFCDHGTCRRLTKKNCHWFKSKSCSKGQKCVFGTCHTPDQDSPCELHSDCTASIFQECFKGKCVISWSFFWFRWFIPLYLFIWVLLFSAVFMCRRAFRMLRKAPLVQKAPKNGHACDYC